MYFVWETFHNQTIEVPEPRGLLVPLKWTPMCHSFPYGQLEHFPPFPLARSASSQAGWQTVASIRLFPEAQVAFNGSIYSRVASGLLLGCKSEIPSFLYVGLKNQTYVIRLGGRNLYLLNHCASPSNILHLPPFSTSENFIS